MFAKLFNIPLLVLAAYLLQHTFLVSNLVCIVFIFIPLCDLVYWTLGREIAWWLFGRSLRDAKNTELNEEDKKLESIFNEIVNIFGLSNRAELVFLKTKSFSPFSCLYSLFGNRFYVMLHTNDLDSWSDLEIKGGIAHELSHICLKWSWKKFLDNSFGFLLIPYMMAESEVDIFASRIIGIEPLLAVLNKMDIKSREEYPRFFSSGFALMPWRIKRIQES